MSMVGEGSYVRCSKCVTWNRFSNVLDPNLEALGGLSSFVRYVLPGKGRRGEREGDETYVSR